MGAQRPQRMGTWVVTFLASAKEVAAVDKPLLPCLSEAHLKAGIELERSAGLPWYGAVECFPSIFNWNGIWCQRLGILSLHSQSIDSLNEVRQGRKHSLAIMWRNNLLQYCQVSKTVYYTNSKGHCKGLSRQGRWYKRKQSTITAFSW